ncbi:hypothetical protein IGS75_01345 [Gluconobacter sphaericus]|uniref:hypothetical protein n=1 Tax=Gluconobacter sphaericus TaxID=574987 RepID=UPI0019237EF7|nr:hypothetical protein [Gluconobacter sphaericus]QQX91315.1 hypothetical protein IGS75_01345 [Gluconobacter sphaericus]
MIVLCAVMRSRVAPRVPYVSAEVIASHVRTALVMPTFESVEPAIPTATLIESCWIAECELQTIMKPVIA